MTIDIKEMKARLQQRKKELQGDVADLTEANPTPVDPIEANDGPRDFEETAVDVTESQQEQVIRGNDRALLTQINEALQRIDEGTYGTCVDCGKPIPEKRLEALPWAARCIEDEEKLEQLDDSRQELYDEQTLE